MSLVNYSSDEEDEEQENEEQEEHHEKFIGPQQFPSSPLPACSPSESSVLSMSSASDTSKEEPEKKMMKENPENLSVKTSIKLPDASQLFSSFDSAKDKVMTDATADISAAKKRADVISGGPLNKIQKSGPLPPPRIPPDTAGGALIPPQLRGRSNIATEDLEKLFTRKHKTSS